MTPLTRFFNGKTALDEVTASRVAQQIIDDFPDAELFTAEGVLQDRPELRPFDTVVADLAYEEFCRRHTDGEILDPTAFAARFPSVEFRLRQQLKFHFVALAVLRKSAAPTNWPPVPSQYLHFDLIQLLGEGGASRVYLAADTRLERRIRVIKLSRSSQREVQSLARLAHASIVDALYADSDENYGFDVLCLPFQGRWTLKQVIDVLKQQPSIRTAAQLWAILGKIDDTPEWARQSLGYSNCQSDRRTLSELYIAWASEILEALAHAHKNGILHCDIKPSNILITFKGTAVLLDFDAAAQIDGAKDSCGGTIPYMAPEQLKLIAGEKDRHGTRLTPATDLYVWAMTFYELITLELPFGMIADTESLEFTIQKQLEARRNSSVNWSRCRSSAPQDLVTVLQACIMFDTRNRLATAQLALEQIQRFERPVRRLSRFARRNPIASTASFAGIILVALVLGSVVRPFLQSDVEAGMRALAGGDLTTANLLLNRAVKNDPENRAARVGAVKASLLNSHYSEAIAHLAGLPVTDWTRRCQAFALLAGGGEFASGADILKDLIAKGRAKPIDYNNAGYALRLSLHQKDIDQADEWLRKATSLDPKLTVAWANRVVLEQRSFARTGTVRDDVILEATQRGLKSVEVSYALGMLWAIRGNAAENKQDIVTAQECERQALSAISEAGECGLENSRLANIELAWSRLAPHIAELRARADRKTVDCPFLCNPALSE